MRCPKCSLPGTRTIDTRSSNNGTVHRRRHCRHCGNRFSTTEGAGASLSAEAQRTAVVVRGEMAHLVTLFRQLDDLLKRLEVQP